MPTPMMRPHRVWPLVALVAVLLLTAASIAGWSLMHH